MDILFNKNIGRNTSQETIVMKYLFCNHFSKILMNSLQIKFINIIESSHNEVSLVSFNERDVKKTGRRLNRIGNTQMDRSILIFNNFARNNSLEKNFDEEELINSQFLSSKQKFSQITDHDEDMVVNESSILVIGTSW
jgi:hypothetical protein